MHEVLARTDTFGIAILTREQEAHSRLFVGQRLDKCDPCFDELCGMPVLKGAGARLVACIVHRYACGDHTLVVGAVEALEFGDRGSADPLLFYAGEYAKLVAPKQAMAAGGDLLPFLY